MSIEQLQNVLNWLEKDLEHFSQDDENIQKQIQKEVSPEWQLVFYTRKWIWRTIKFCTRKMRKEEMYVFPAIHMQERTFCIIFKWFLFWDFSDFKISKLKKSLHRRRIFLWNKIISEAQLYIRLLFRIFFSCRKFCIGTASYWIN